MSAQPARPKGPDAFRTIGEASAEVGVAPHVLRFWEGKFQSLQPLKRAGGRRYYRPSDIALLLRIKQLLHVEGMTVKGAQKALRARAGKRGADAGDTVNAERLAAELRTLAAECRAVASGAAVPFRPND